MAVEVADRVWVSDKTQNRDFIVSNVPSQSVPIDITAHDKAHKAVIASIVVESGPSSIAGPQEEEPIHMQKARALLDGIKQRAVELQEEVLEVERAAEETYRRRGAKLEEAALNALMAERHRADEERHRAEEEEKARAEAAALNQRRDDEARAERCRAEEAALNQLRDDEERARLRAAAILDEEKRVDLVEAEVEQAERRQEAVAEQAERRRAGEKRVQVLAERAERCRISDEKNVQHEPEQPEQTAETDAEMEARRTVVLTNDALATHSSPN